MIKKVCVIGDSVARGVVLNGETEKYVLLKDCFANRMEEEGGLIVRNLSRFGSTVTKGLETVKLHRDELGNYDHVVLEFGGNDCDYNWAQISADPDGEHLPHTQPKVFTEQYARMIDEVRSAGSRPVLLSLPPINAQAYFSWFSRGISGANILHWLGDVEHIYRWHEMYNLAVERLAASLEVPLADITTPFLESRDCPNLICRDGIHPNERGHELICRVLNGELARNRKAFAC